MTAPVLLADGFEDLSLFAPLFRLREEGAEVRLASPLLTAAAGYDPAEAPAFWDRMDAGGGSGPVFASTHPAPASRIADLKRWQAEAGRLLGDPQPERALPGR